ncbi:MAG: MFS transporter [Brevefilum sp.]
MIGRDVKKLRSKHPEFVATMEKYYWWNFILLVFDSAIYAFSISALSQDTIIPYFVDQLTDRSWIIGMVPAIFYLGLHLPQLIGAFMVHARRTKKKFILQIAIAERVGILLIALVAQSYGLLSDQLILILFLLSYMVFSITNGMISPGYSDFISKSIIRNRGIFFGFMNGLGGLIGFGASLFSRYLLDTFAFPINIRTLFWVALATSAISPILIANLKEVPYPIQTQKEDLKQFIKTIPDHLRKQPEFIRFIISRAFLGLGVLGNAFYALYGRQLFMQTAGSLAIFTMIILFTQSLIGFLWGWLGDRFGYKKVYVIVSFLVVIQGFLALFATEPWMIYLIAFCIGSVYAAFRICDSNMIFEIAPSSETSRFVGITNTFVAPIMTLAPLLGGALVDIFSHQVMFVAVIVVGIISTVLALVVMPQLRQKH